MRWLISFFVATIALSMGRAFGDWRLRVSSSTPVYADDKLLLFFSGASHSFDPGYIAIVAYNVSSQAKLWTQPAPCKEMQFNVHAALFRRTGPTTISYTCGYRAIPLWSLLAGLESLDDRSGSITVSHSISLTIGYSLSTFIDGKAVDAVGDVRTGTYCVYVPQHSLPVCLLGATNVAWTPSLDITRSQYWASTYLKNGALVVIIDAIPFIFDAATGVLRTIAGGGGVAFANGATCFEDVTVLLQPNALGTADITSVSVVNNTNGAGFVANRGLEAGPVYNNQQLPPIVFRDTDPNSLLVGLAYQKFTFGNTPPPPTNFSVWRVSLSPNPSASVVSPLVYTVVFSTAATADFGCAETSGYVLCGSAEYSTSAPSWLFHAASGTVVDTSTSVALAAVTSFETIGNMLIAQGPPTASASVNDVWTAAFDRKSGAFLWLRTLNSIDGTIGYDAADDCVVLMEPSGEVVCIGING